MVKIMVKDLLETKGYTKYWLYKRMGMSYQNISKIWNGETNAMRYDIMEKLCKVLECTPNDLFDIQYEKES